MSRQKRIVGLEYRCPVCEQSVRLIVGASGCTHFKYPYAAGKCCHAGDRVGGALMSNHRSHRAPKSIPDLIQSEEAAP